jgi:hypothetical protein
VKQEATLAQRENVMRSSRMKWVGFIDNCFLSRCWFLKCLLVCHFSSRGCGRPQSAISEAVVDLLLQRKGRSPGLESSVSLLS